MFFEKNGDIIVISGQTFPHREFIKSLGGKYNRLNRTWVIPFSEESLSSLGQFKLETPTQPSSVKKSAEPSKNQALTLSELTQRASTAISKEFPSDFLIIAEISSIDLRSYGYFIQLTEKMDSQKNISLSATLWQRNITKLKKTIPIPLQELLTVGSKICFRAEVSLYKDRGSISLNIIDIDPTYTKGLIAKKREATIKSLKDQGIFNDNRSHTLSELCVNIGLITAKGSRALSDFTDQLAQSKRPFKVHLCDAMMQGVTTEKSVLQALERLKHLKVQCVVITRGGGSATDLGWFDSLSLSQAVCRYPIPIISAIGHFEDISVVDLVAFNSQKTPTAAAEFFVKRLDSLENNLSSIKNQLHLSSKNILENRRKLLALQKQNFQARTRHFLSEKKNVISLLKNNISMTSQQTVDQAAMKLTMKRGQLHQDAQSTMQSYKTELKEFKHLIQTKDPKPWFDKGWSKILDAEGHVLTFENSKKGNVVSAIYPQGTLELVVNNKARRKTYVKEKN